MRTKTLLLTAAVVAAGAASSMAQSNVYSLNIVGYVNIPVQKGKSYMLNNPFDTGNGNNVTNVLIQPFTGTNGVPDPALDYGYDGTQLYQFKQGTGYINETYASGFGWFAGTGDPGVGGDGVTPTLTLPPGKGFWLIPTTNGTVTFTGSVVLSNSITLLTGANQVGSAYPGASTLAALNVGIVATAADNAALNHANDGDTIYRFLDFTIPAGYAGTPFHYGGGVFYAAGYGWYDNDAPASSNGGNGGGDTNGPVLNPGEGFFYTSVKGSTWPQSFTVN